MTTPVDRKKNRKRKFNKVSVCVHLRVCVRTCVSAWAHASNNEKVINLREKVINLVLDMGGVAG